MFKLIVRQRRVPTMILGDSCTNVATSMVEPQECPGLVAEAGRMWREEIHNLYQILVGSSDEGG